MSQFYLFVNNKLFQHRFPSFSIVNSIHEYSVINLILKNHGDGSQTILSRGSGQRQLTQSQAVGQKQQINELLN